MVELMKVPKEAIYTSDNQYLAEQLMDEFFLNIKEYILRLYEDDHPSNLEIKSGEITYPRKIVKDRLTYLVFNHEGEHIVASVLCTQTKVKNWNYTFFRDLSFF